ncbi:hypothetical protein Q3G72_017245 [Acer saccharum]|nr:hypothetical protein Q3G72_017245 [Acer saccharum]
MVQLQSHHCYKKKLLMLLVSLFMKKSPIRAYMARIFFQIVQFHPLKLETSPALCSYGMWSFISYTFSSLEYRAFEILVFLAGLIPNAELTTSLIAMCVNTETIVYMITYGLSAAARSLRDPWLPLSHKTDTGHSRPSASTLPRDQERSFENTRHKAS